MPCPVCEHTMRGLTAKVYWCPRCGTVRDVRHYHPDIVPDRWECPSLVDRVKELIPTLDANTLVRAHVLGILEAVNRQDAVIKIPK